MLAGLFWVWAPVVVWAGVIFGLSSIPSLSTGWGLWDFVLRKIAHIAEFGILTVLLVRAYLLTWAAMPLRRLIWWTVSLAILYAVSDEIHQGFVPGRTPSFADVLIDSCGVLLVLLIYRRNMKFQMMSSRGPVIARRPEGPTRQSHE